MTQGDPYLTTNSYFSWQNLIIWQYSKYWFSISTAQWSIFFWFSISTAQWLIFSWFSISTAQWSMFFWFSISTAQWSIFFWFSISTAQWSIFFWFSISTAWWLVIFEFIIWFFSNSILYNNNSEIYNDIILRLLIPSYLCSNNSGL